ncbi:unnamed protein product [Parnassius apollo]|uniref:(apollo) hypothetical protein n=1 Tax=Parnassius apollo TaxID=110799 RepID=A0A8S3XA39_PARAO|nr:unnamed protein product [Parnassius apollo]
MTPLSAKETLKRNKAISRMVHLAEAICLIPDDIDIVLVQYRNIGEHDWENKDANILVFKYKDPAGINLYQALRNLAKIILSLTLNER